MKRNVYKRIGILLCLLLCMSLGMMAQMIKGIVTESSGSTLPGVNVLVKGTTRGTITDTDGKYSIEAKKGETLQFSFIGYGEKELEVGNSVVINVQLLESATTLQEVVAIGYGTMKSSHVTSSISKVKSDEISDRPVSRIDQAIQGKIAGVVVNETSGAPGKTLNVKVRGTNSINNASGPLYVVDGFPISGDLRGINMDDIESIEVLKDASSAAIYGSRGAGGVILITTKSGKKGKPIISLVFSYGVQKRFSKVDVLNREDYIEYAIEERTNSYIYNGGDLSVPEKDRENYKYAIDPLWRTNPTSFPDHDWQDIIDRTAPRQNYTVSVQGGTENTKYYVSTNYLDQKGIIFNSGFNRLSFQSNVEAKANKYITFGINLHVSYSKRTDPDTDTNQGPISRSILVAPIVGINQQTVEGGNYYYHAHFYLNPLALAKEIHNVNRKSEFLGNSFLRIKINGLQFKTSIGYNVINFHNDYFRPLNINRGNPSYGIWNSSLHRNILNENTLIYNLERDTWTLNLLAGYTYQKDDYDSNSFQKKDFPDDEIITANGATTIQSGSGSATRNVLISYLGRANFSYLNRYFFTASIRRDGSSRFGKNNRWGIFPAVSIGWMMSDEKFFRIPVISNLKFRASYGGVGNNNIGDYASIGTLSTTNAVHNNIVYGGYAPDGFSNADLTWEKTFTTDVGIDLGFFKNRINLSLDHYVANTSDMLLNVPIPETTGFREALQNIGKLQNKGFEVELAIKNIVGTFNWSTNFNLAYNQNKVKQLGPDASPIMVYNSGFPIQKIEIGKPLRYFYLFKTDGLFKDATDCEVNKEMSYANKNPRPGDIKYKDMNGDGKITADDKTDCGNTVPKFTWGFTNTFSYRGIELSIFMDGVSKCSLINMGRKETIQSRGNVKGYWRNRWRSEEDPGNGIVPRACTTDNLTTPSDWWLENATFWRVRNIKLSYNLPGNLISKIPFVSSLKIYTSVDNVYMHDHYNHMSQNADGIDYDLGYPLARTYEFGVSMKF